MRIGKKFLTRIAVVTLSLVALFAIREAFFSYNTYFVIVPGAKLFTNGKRSEGWLHKGANGRVLILTRPVPGRRESYLISRPGDKGGGVGGCDSWSASKFPLVAFGDVNPPCLKLAREGGNEGLPKQPPVFNSRSVEFTADDGARLKVKW